MQLTDEQNLLKTAVEHFVSRDYTFDARNAVLKTGEPFSARFWAQYAELGWLGAGLAEEVGGFGGGPVEQAVIAEGLGRAMALEPYVSSAIMAAHGLTLLDEPERGQQTLTQLVAGETLVAVAFAEAASRYDLHQVTTTARPGGGEYILDGTKLAVFDAPSADILIVAARVAGGPRDTAGIGLFQVASGTGGMAQTPFRTMDGTMAANIQFSDCEAQLLVGPERGFDVLEQMVERAIIARCAQAVGAMDTAYTATLEYVKTREQFGVRIGTFQVLQHRLVDMFIRVKECQAMVLMSAGELADADAQARRLCVSGAKTYVGRRARKVAQEVVQMHGGIGMTEELNIGHFFRYLTQFCTSFGSTDHHLKRYAEVSA
ncbi:MAG: pimeloyl-CoA dehydrogenase small subunit [Chromatiales bacterium]|nr:pimeloyl-CoA dehydrogenase small subunit [Chromatiales bacterium]